MTATEERKWVLIDDMPVGPFTIEDLREKYDRGEINQFTLTCAEGSDEWSPVGSKLEKLNRGKMTAREDAKIPPIAGCAIVAAVLGGVLTASFFYLMPEPGSLTSNLHVVLLAAIATPAVLVCYFLPTVIAYSRKHRNALPIFVINLLLTPSVIGWVGALAWALYVERSERPVSQASTRR